MLSCPLGALPKRPTSLRYSALGLKFFARLRGCPSLFSRRWMELFRAAGDLPLEAGGMAGRGFHLRDLQDARYVDETGRLARSRPRSVQGAQAKAYATCVLSLHALAAVCPEGRLGASQEEAASMTALVPASRPRRVPVPVETVPPPASELPVPPASRLRRWVPLQRLIMNPWYWVLAFGVLSQPRVLSFCFGTLQL